MATTENKTVGIGDWILTFILLAIPGVNIILIIIWACGGTSLASKKTFAQAYLIMMVIGIAAVVGLFATVFNNPTFKEKFNQALQEQQRHLASPSPAPAVP